MALHLSMHEAGGRAGLEHPLREGELPLPSTSYSSWENKPCLSPGQHSRAVLARHGWNSPKAVSMWDLSTLLVCHAGCGRKEMPTLTLHPSLPVTDEGAAPLRKAGPALAWAAQQS